MVKVWIVMSTAAGGGMFCGKRNEWKCLRTSVQTGDCCSLLPVTTELRIPDTKITSYFSPFQVKYKDIGQNSRFQ